MSYHYCYYVIIILISTISALLLILNLPPHKIKEYIIIINDIKYTKI